MPGGVPRLFVVADDLTGANDTGVQFARRGVSAFVFLKSDFDHFPPAAQVVVVNTESRHLPPEIAARLVSSATTRAHLAGVPYFYKKTDSTLRGNLGAELEAFRAATRSTILPFVPAFPELGRTTRCGIHHVFDRPIAETTFASDPLNPIRQSSICHLLREQTDAPLLQLPAGSTLPVPGEFEGIVVPDCANQADMSAIAQECFGRRVLKAASGSAAFAQEMARFIAFESGSSEFTAPRAPVLFVNGSVNERALHQVSHPSSSSFVRFRLPPEAFASDERAAQFIETVKGKLSSAPQRVMLHTITRRDELAGYEATIPAAGESIHLRVANVTGRIVRELLRTGYFKTLIVFGGDTFNAIADASQWAGFVPETEIAPGVTVAAPAGTDLKVISKAGGFGEVDLVGSILSAIG